MLNCCSRDQGIWNFETVAPREFAKQFSGQFTDFVVRRDAYQRAEEDRDKLMFVWKRARPNFRRDHW